MEGRRDVGRDIWLAPEDNTEELVLDVVCLKCGVLSGYIDNNRFKRLIGKMSVE